MSDLKAALQFLKNKGINTEEYVIHDINGGYLPQIPIATWLTEFAEQQANGVDTITKPELHKHGVNRWAYLFDNSQPIMLGIAIALAFNVVVTMFENVIVKIALIIHGG